jgi:hypothetical protein
VAVEFDTVLEAAAAGGCTMCGRARGFSDAALTQCPLFSLSLCVCVCECVCLFSLFSLLSVSVCLCWGLAAGMECRLVRRRARVRSRESRTCIRVFARPD